MERKKTSRRRRRPRRQRQAPRPRQQPAGPPPPPLEEALNNSPADETELVWIESSRQTVSTRNKPEESRPTLHTTLSVRVLERGRLGAFRTGSVDRAGLAQGIRQAIAQSRTRDTLQGLPHLPAGDATPTPDGNPPDPAIGKLDESSARELLRKHLGKRENGELSWGETEVTIANSRGLRRKARVSHATFEVTCGRTPGSGHAAGSARSLDVLDIATIVERARASDGHGEAAEPELDKVPIVLSPEATIRLFSMLNQAAFTASAYHDGSSFLREHMGTQVFDRRIHLLDDATDGAGLPFPFDLEGSLKGPVDLIVKGTPRTPALDQRQAALLGLQPTAHAVAGNDAQAQNLFLLPGESSRDELLEVASGGLYLGWLDRVECFDPLRVRFRATARGVRRIEEGALSAPVPDLVWEDTLLRSLSNVSGLGTEVVTWAQGGSFDAAATAPAIALADIVGLRVLSA
jgi:predicted Zn-dependent protease